MFMELPTFKIFQVRRGSEEVNKAEITIECFGRTFLNKNGDISALKRFNNLEKGYGCQ